MIKHKIYVKRQRQGLGEGLYMPLIRRSVRATLDAEGVDVPCEISVLITDDKGIQAINKEFRNIDDPTDVLSFPMQELKPGEFSAESSEISPETGRLPLGDIIISVERVKAQAKEFNHGGAREMSYLIIHSTLHLLGYDHLDEGEEKRKMRKRENIILEKVGFRL